jgi:transposase
MTKQDESVEAGTESVVQRRRGKWTAQQRRRIVADSRVAGASVQEVAERHGVRPNLLPAWRRQDDASRAVKPVKFAAVKLSAAPADGVDRDRSRRWVCAGARDSRRDDAAGSLGGGAMIGMPHGARIWLACGVTDLRRGFDGLSALVQTQLAAGPYAGHLFVFRGRRGNRLKILWYSGDGMNLLSKRLDGGRFAWPQAATGTVALTSAELSMLLEGIDWRRARRTTLAPIDLDRIVPTRAA